MQSEITLLDLAQVTYEMKDVLLADGNLIHYVVCGDLQKPPFLLLHGYCGGGAVYYKMLPSLVQNYCVYLMDFLGMGRSSRPSFYAHSVEETEQFFVQSVEEFRQAIHLERFVLAGHSFGGYVAGCYTLAFPECVSHLLLLSPIGVKEKPPEYTFEKQLIGAGWKVKAFWSALFFLWGREITPFSVLRKAGPFSRNVLHIYTRRRLLALGEVELLTVEDYLEQVCLLPGSGEYGLVHILEAGAYARKPLSPRLTAVTVPMAFFYGASDWVSPEGALQVSEHTSTPVAIRVIPDTGHQMCVENPEGLVQAIYSVLANPQEKTVLSPSQIWPGK